MKDKFPRFIANKLLATGANSFWLQAIASDGEPLRHALVYRTCARKSQPQPPVRLGLGQICTQALIATLDQGCSLASLFRGQCLSAPLWLSEIALLVGAEQQQAMQITVLEITEHFEQADSRGKNIQPYCSKAE